MLLARIRPDFKSSDAFVPAFSEVLRSGRLRWTFDVLRVAGGRGDEKIAASLVECHLMR
jgi:hypothetical protein